MTSTVNSRLAKLRFFPRLPIKVIVSIGFFLAVLPLLLGIASAYIAVDKLVGISQQTIYTVAQQVQNSRQIIEKAISLERKCKQFLVLDDSISLQAYKDEREQFHAIINNLHKIEATEEVKKTVRDLDAYEKSVYTSLVLNKPSDKLGKLQAHEEPEQRLLKKATELFPELHTKAREVSQGFSDYVNQEVNTLPIVSKSVQRNLIIQSLTVLPISLILILVFIRMIISPIRQIDHAIRGLGMGNFNVPIKVSGSLDLEYLGERLEWLRTRLNELEEAKQNFMHNVSHAIKSPLATLREGADMLGDEIMGPLNSEQLEIAKMLINTTHKVEDLIDALINYDQTNAQRQDVSMENVEMESVILDLLEEFTIQLRSKQINVNTKLESIKIVSNHAKLRIIIDNLLSNAIKYSPPGGDISITLQQLSGHAVLEVEDNGPGINPDERKKIFEPFFQGHASREGGIYGTGLGLAILSECINSLHGRVEALEPHGSGARMRVQLPID
ncbi:MAG: HAMP domain-containing sensor histidine kinase [Proteobacteria bacterium]|nr:HAMP domain-containing sensor histidine kinase [Pseudomonadota bacterium]